MANAEPHTFFIDFAVELYAALAKQYPDLSKNLFFSPVSIHAALSLALAGAKTDTASELKQGLKLHSYADPTKMHSAVGDALRCLFAHSKGAKSVLANRLFVQKDKTLLTEFSTLAKTHYNADAEQLDFQGNPDGGRQMVNTWVKEKTEGKIADLLPAGSVTPETILIIANAIYFKGLWVEPFPKEGTAVRQFHLLGGSEIQIPSMCTEKRMLFAEFPNLAAKAVRLPFKESTLALVVVLPNKVDGLSNLLQELLKKDAGSLSQVLGTSKFSPREVTLTLPKFKVGGQPSISLNEVLSAMGMKSMFVRGHADLSGLMGTKNIYVSSVQHQAILEVDEEGAEAAAATGMVAMAMCMPPPPIPVCVDHPFIVGIVDQQGVPLFLGHVSKPEQLDAK